MAHCVAKGEYGRTSEPVAALQIHLLVAASLPPGGGCGAQPVRLRTAVALPAALAVLVLIGAFAAPASADVLVSNVGQTPAGGQGIASGGAWTTAFTVGTASDSDSLAYIGILFSSADAGAQVVVTLHTAESNGDPGQLVTTLTSPASLTAGLNLFPAAGGVTVASSAKYVVRITPANTVDFGVSITNADAQDAGGSIGWSIDDNARWCGGGCPSYGTSSQVLQITVNSNSEATGAPAVSGTLGVGEVLTAGRGTLADADLLPVSDADLSWQWVRQDDATGAGAADITGATSSTYTLTAADEGKFIAVKASFTDRGGTSEGPRTSQGVGPVTPVNVATVPGAPRDLMASAVGANQISLSWDEPANDGGAAITGYRIEVSTDGNPWSDLRADTGSTNTSYSHAGLTAGDTRNYRVSAINSVGTGPASNVDSATTFTVPGAPTGLTASVIGETQIDLSWDAPANNGGADITGYRIEASADGNPWSNLEANTRTASRAYSHTGLLLGDTRNYRVSAINSVGRGPASNVDSATTAATAAVPGAPTGLTASAAGETQIDLSWEAPANNGGAAITGYRIEASADGNPWSNLVVTTGNTNTTCSHTDLSAGATRHYRVSAVNSLGTGPASNVDSATTPTPTTDDDADDDADDNADDNDDDNDDAPGVPTLPLIGSLVLGLLLATVGILRRR